MHLFYVSFLLIGLAWTAQCFPMVILVRENGIEKYALVELEVMGTESWMFIMKSTQVITEDSVGKINQDCESWYDVRRNCVIRLVDQKIYNAATLEFPKEGNLIEGYIDDVQIGEGKFKGSVRILIKMHIRMSVTQNNTKEKFNGLMSVTTGVLFLMIDRNKSKVQIKSFQNVNSTLTQFTEEGSKSKQVVLNLTQMKTATKFYEKIEFIFLSYEEVQNIDKIKANFGNPVLNAPNCNVTLFFAKHATPAVGISYVNNLTGTIWIQSIWDDTGKSDVNTNEKFVQLQNLIECRISRIIPNSNPTDVEPFVADEDWITVNVINVNFDPSEKKFIIKFDLGEEICLNFESKLAKAHANTKAQLITLFGTNMSKLDEALISTGEGLEIKVIDGPDSITKANCEIIKVNRHVHHYDGPANVFGCEFKQYYYYH